MPSKPPLALADRISTSIKQLSESAVKLNDASDELTNAIAPIDAALKKLNLGVTAWHRLTHGVQDDGSYWSYNIGYAKVSGKWGLAISSVSGHVQLEVDDEDVWPFNDAPRWIRIQAIDSIPDLLETLVKQADKLAAELQQKSAQARELAETISAVPTMQQGRK
jgi:methyl-accepting chemotaxis protein